MLMFNVLHVIWFYTLTGRCYELVMEFKRHEWLWQSPETITYISKACTIKIHMNYTFN